MSRSERQYSRREGLSIRTEKLSDDSMVIYEQISQQVHSLNPVGAAVWEACSVETSEPAILEAVRAKLGPATDEDAVWSAVQSLQDANLIVAEEPELAEVSAAVIGPSRRSVLSNLRAAIIVPAVITMTMAEQKAAARIAKSCDQVDYRNRFK